MSLGMVILLPLADGILPGQLSGEHGMSENQLPAIGGKSFEALKLTNQHDAEYWSARDLQPLLGYSQWRRFEQAIERAITSCKESGNNPDYHFAAAGKMVGLGSGSAREVADYHLSRFACYLIAQNGDPRKPEIALAQKYFAVQARRQELSDQLAADLERMELRKQTGEEFKALSGAAQQAGVQSRMFGIFHDAGYKGLYGGLGRDAIKSRKGIPDKENLMDRMNASELAANQFRMTQTRDKLARESIHDQQQAIRTHEQVGKEVRDAIKRIGGDLPETIPPAEHIKEVEKRIKTSTPKLELDPHDAGGLLGDADDKKKGA
jgi:DNA-damage-inducible protein D